MNETIRKFGYPDTLVHEYRHWVVLLRPQQVTLGALVLACREPALAFHEVSVEAFGELKTAVSDIEQAVGRLVEYERINYLMLMMVDPDVHFHVIPRYREAREHGGLSFPDHGWPGPPALGQFTDTDAAALAGIKSRLAEHWPTH